MGPDFVHQAITLGQDALKLVVLISAPPLLTALVVGMGVSVLQTATQIQEMTLTFIPKIVAVLAWSHNLGGSFASAIACPTARVESIRDSLIKRRFSGV